MAAYVISGGRQLQGEIRLQGAKNSALPILAATVLIPGVSVLHHCPDLSDTRNALKILRHLGCRVEMEQGTVTVDASTLSGYTIPVELMDTMRSSILFAGALLNRVGDCDVTYPGGCRIGERPIDLHLQAFAQLGCEVECREDGRIRLHRQGEPGGVISFPFPSVGATENAMLAAAGRGQKTMIVQAAREPEIIDLQGFLCKAGLDVAGAGTSTVVLAGGKAGPVEYTIMPDRICGETYLAAVAAVGGRIRLLGAAPENSKPMLDILRSAGCDIRTEGENIELKSSGKLCYTGMVRTGPYPAFSTDSGSLLTAALLRAQGTALLAETVFENRFQHIEELRKLGSNLEICGRLCCIRGCDELEGADMTARDLRGGAALVIGALQARGQSLVRGTEYIHRGYENFSQELGSLGADIEETGEIYGKEEDSELVVISQGVGKTSNIQWKQTAK